MAGEKRGREERGNKRSKISRKESRSSRGNESKQKRSRRNSQSECVENVENPSVYHVRAEFIEGDQLIEMEAEGQATDFASEVKKL